MAKRPFQSSVWGVNPQSQELRLWFSLIGEVMFVWGHNSFLGVNFGNDSASRLHARLKRSQTESPEDTCNSDRDQAKVEKTTYCGA
ncbi:MAG: hypothetical protein KatS3mg066_0258 [Fischerella sp.]|nr:MAG: hypothetical protein KatS3mg066_0258 [Fischerella sp.]